MRESTKRLLRATYPLYRPMLRAAGRLDVMARMHRTDKHAHGYTRYYRDIFRPLRRAPIKLFEIGIGGAGPDEGGGSLKMWKDYFPRAEIFALDINDKSGVREPRVHVFRGDQNDPALLDALARRWGPFDIIIDDGSHISEHIITSFRALFPHLAEGGHYVIEDLFFSYDENNGGDPDDLYSPRTSLGFLKSLIDDMHWKYIPRPPSGYGDRIGAISFFPKICFIRKGDNTGRDPVVEHYWESFPRRQHAPG